MKNSDSEEHFMAVCNYHFRKLFFFAFVCFVCDKKDLLNN